jgi:hypothetical protein
MSVCPVCQYHHQEEVSKCQRCNWLMQDSLDFIGISPDHPIVKIYIPLLVKCFKDENEALRSNLQILDLDIQKANNQKLDEIIDAIEDSKKQYINEIKTLTEQVIELRSLIENTNNQSTNSFIAPEPIPASSPIEDNSVNFDSRNIGNIEDNENNSVFPIESDRNLNNADDPELNPQEGSLYDESDREFYENFETQENIDFETNSNSNYQQFYRLIKKGEIEVIKVTVPQENIEKMRGGTLSELKFINDSKGNYWIVDWQNVYCLIPKKNINIQEHNYGNFQRIFNCQNYQETYSGFEVIEPATVFKSDHEAWQLERKGKINFI